MGGVVAAQFTAPAVAMLALHWLSLWLGFYFLARRPRAVTTALAGCAYLAMSGYLVATAILVSPEYIPHPVVWGSLVGGLVPFAPALLLHAYLRLGWVKLERRRLVLTVAYVAAGLVYVLGFSDTLLYEYSEGVPGATVDVNGTTDVGPLYPVQVVQICGTLLLAVLVLVRERREQRGAAEVVPRQLDAIMLGTVLLLAGAAAMFANTYFGRLTWESLLQPIVVAGAALVAVPLARYPGLLDGQLLRTDLKASFVGALLVMAAFAGLVLAAGGSLRVLIVVGWFPLAVYVFRDDLRALADRAFYGAGSRAGRAGLRVAATYSGAATSLDVAALSPGQATEAVEYLSDVERAGLASARLEGLRDSRLTLLARDEFAEVRAALGLPAGWSPGDGLPADAVRRHVAATLEPRERQALGLRYLGYSDKEMARLMGVKPNVPRSYLSEGKRKLGLTAGAPLMLFVHFAGVVETDALPLLGPGERGEAGSTGTSTPGPTVL